MALDPAGLLGGWQALNRDATLHHCIAQLEAAGNLDNLRRLTGGSDSGFRGYCSPTPTCTSARGGRLGARRGRASRGRFVDEASRLLRAAQGDDGYLNSYFQVPTRPHAGRPAWGHELYCAGHLIQAAVAAARAPADAPSCSRRARFADLLVARFGAGREDASRPPGDRDARWSSSTGTRASAAYLDLAAASSSSAATGCSARHRFGASYFQDHVPVREATEVDRPRRPPALPRRRRHRRLPRDRRRRRCWPRWRSCGSDLVATKTYLTGGHGSRHRDEAFGDPYELPPDRAYAETCAAIGSFLWNWRMLLATGAARYADVMERALYNAVAAGSSLDGDRFFYSNPLQLRAGHDGADEDRPSGRLPWYRCAVLPAEPRALVAIAARTTSPPATTAGCSCTC